MAILRQVAFIASLVPLVVADIGTGGYLLIGNDAPWGLPDSSFRPPSQANATGSFTIPGFNLSSSNPSVQGDGHNWNIEISVQANIPLNGSNDTSLSAAEKNEFTQFTSMSLSNVEKTEVSKIAKGNKMCGYVMLGLKANVIADNQDDATKGGKCDFLSQQCQRDLNAAAQGGFSDCSPGPLPDSCNDWLGPSGDQVFQITSFVFNEKLITDGRFFTAASAPTSENNETEYDSAVRYIWPVILTWSHTSNTPDNMTTTTSALRCLRASNITSGGHSNAAGLNSAPTFWLTLFLMGFASGLAFL